MDIMVLPVDYESREYLFYKNLNEDVKLKSDAYGRWDIDFDFENDDWINVTGSHSVFNACVIAIMTRFQELNFIDLYEDFGCRVHELIKENKSRNMMYNMELFVTEVLENMRRIKKVNWVVVTDSSDSNHIYNYNINFSVTCRLDEDVVEDDGQLIVVEESLLI